jgi:pimeloyl-ACP methyl ester carboxylesterase
VFEKFKVELGKAIASSGKETTVEQQLLEATATVGGYNLVSRLLVALDVDDRAEMEVPVPEVAEIDVPGCRIHAVHVRNFESSSAPTLIFINSLLTNYTMWEPIMPFFAKKYNMIFYDQRGHGASAVPADKCTVQQLADDAAAVLAHFGVEKAKAVIGVSQGGATALSFAIRHADKIEKVVACDTQAKSPEANRKAWDDRIELAKTEGMGALERATVPRWFSSESSFQPDSKYGKAISAGVINTKVEGFAKGAAALQGYDLLADGLVETLRSKYDGGKNALLCAGECDGALPKGLQNLGQEVDGGSGTLRVEIIPKGGHLPMVNEPEAWAKAVNGFLEK